MLVSSDDQVKAYIKKIMSQLDKWMVGGKISKLVVVITSKDTGEPVERWQFDVCPPPPFLTPLSPPTRFNAVHRSKYSPSRPKKNPPPSPPIKKIPLPPAKHSPLRKQKPKSKPRSNPFSDKSPPQSHSYHNSMAIARLMCWYMQMRIVRSQWIGVIARRGRLLMGRRFSWGVLVRRVIRLIRLLVIGLVNGWAREWVLGGGFVGFEQYCTWGYGGVVMESLVFLRLLFHCY